MMACASFACLAQASFASQQYAQDSAPYLWMILCALVAISSGLILLSRNSHPQAVFWTACLLVVVLPFDSLIVLMALTPLLARRQDVKMTLRSVLTAAAATIWSQVRDALQSAELTRDSLLRLIGDVRAAGMRIDTWIDIQQLGQLDDSISMIAYRVVQEGLTMKRFVKCFFELLTQIIVKVRKCKVQRVCVLHFQLAGSGSCFFLMKLYH